MFDNFSKKYIYTQNTRGRKTTSDFLKKLGLSFDGNVNVTINILDGKKIIATASAEKNLIKCIGVDENYRSKGLMNTLISEIISHQYDNNIYDLSIITKIENEKVIQSLGFETICETENIILMENNKKKFKKYLENISKNKVAKEQSSAIVMNLNPITKGHMYLIEKAAKESEQVYIFIVSEDKSKVPFETRVKLAKESTKFLENVKIIEGGDYIISSKTFPTYFSKNVDEWINNYCDLDLKLFGKFISKELNIRKRYVGKEPYCELTSFYNKKMKEILPLYNIQVTEIERLEQNQKAISASLVRKLAEKGNISKIKELVPEATYKYYISKED